MENPEKETIGDRAEKLAKRFTFVSDEIKADLEKAAAAVLGVAFDAARKAEKIAAVIAIKAEKLHEDYKIDDRLAGSAAGAKAGAVFGGLRGGVHGATVLGITGAVVGFAVGHKGVEQFRKWRNSHKDSDPKPPQP